MSDEKTSNYRVQIPVRDIIAALEGAAANADTDPRWLAAAELRRLTGWESYSNTLAVAAHEPRSAQGFWCYLGADGRVCADSSFKDEKDAWRVMLGWPSEEEIEAAKARGSRVMRMELAESRAAQPRWKQTCQRMSAGKQK